MVIHCQISEEHEALAALEVPAIYLSSFIDELVTEPATREALLSGLGLAGDGPPPPGQGIALNRVLPALASIDALAGPGWHIAPTLALDATVHGPLGVAVITATTVEKAVATLLRFESTRAPWTLLKAEDSAGRRSLSMLPTLALPPPGELLLEINLIALVGLLSRVLGRQRDRLVVVLPERYRAWTPQLAAALPGELRFAPGRHAISLPQSDLALPCPAADPALHAHAMRQCETLLSCRGGGPLAASIRNQLLAAEGRDPGLAHSARQLGMSSRSLIRHLAARGTRYRALVDEVRQSLARDWLLSSDLSVAEIGARLGYRDAANFGRAFQRWYGLSPGRFRQRQGS